jgi:hypothetical protein
MDLPEELFEPFKVAITKGKQEAEKIKMEKEGRKIAESLRRKQRKHIAKEFDVLTQKSAENLTPIEANKLKQRTLTLLDEINRDAAIAKKEISEANNLFNEIGFDMNDTDRLLNEAIEETKKRQKLLESKLEAAELDPSGMNELYIQQALNRTSDFIKRLEQSKKDIDQAALRETHELEEKIKKANLRLKDLDSKSMRLGSNVYPNFVASEERYLDEYQHNQTKLAEQQQQREQRRLEMKKIADERAALLRQRGDSVKNIIETSVQPIQPPGTLPVVPETYRYQAVETLLQNAEHERMSQVVNTPTLDILRNLSMPTTERERDILKKTLMEQYRKTKADREEEEQAAIDFFEDEQDAKRLAYAYPIKIARDPAAYYVGTTDEIPNIHYYTDPIPTSYSDIKYLPQPSAKRAIYQTKYNPITIPEPFESRDDSFSSLSMDESESTVPLPEKYSGKTDLERLKDYSDEFMKKMSKFSKNKYAKMVKWLNDKFNINVTKGKKLVFSGLSPQGEFTAPRRVPLTTAVSETFKDITNYIGDKSDVIKQYLQSLMQNPNDPYDPINDDWQPGDLVKVPSKFSVVASNLYKLINQNAIRWFKDVTGNIPKNKGELSKLMSNALNYFETVTDFSWMDRMKNYISNGMSNIPGFLTQHGSEVWKTVTELIKKEGPGIAKSLLMAALISLGTVAAKKAFEYIFPSEAKPNEIIHKHVLPDKPLSDVDITLLLELLKKPAKPEEDHSLYIKKKIDNLLNAKIQANWDWEGYNRNRLVPSTKYGY